MKRNMGWAAGDRKTTEESIESQNTVGPQDTSCVKNVWIESSLVRCVFQDRRRKAYLNWVHCIFQMRSLRFLLLYGPWFEITTDENLFPQRLLLAKL